MPDLPGIRNHRQQDQAHLRLLLMRCRNRTPQPERAGLADQRNRTVHGSFETKLRVAMEETSTTICCTTTRRFSRMIAFSCCVSRGSFTGICHSSQPSGSHSSTSENHGHSGWKNWGGPHEFVAQWVSATAIPRLNARLGMAHALYRCEAACRAVGRLEKPCQCRRRWDY